MKSLLLPIFIVTTVVAFSQSPYTKLISNIQAQEINFPFPQKDTMITVGEIDINNNKPVVNYLIPIQNTKVIDFLGSPESSGDLGLPGPNRTVYTGGQHFKITYREINVNHNLRFKLRFTIKNWESSTNSLTVIVGSQRTTVFKADTEIALPNILDSLAYVNCYTNDPVEIKRPIDAPDRTDKYVFKINWHSAGAGIVSLPVLPVKIIYAPVVDFKQTNTASISNSNSQGYNSSVSLNSVNNSTTSLPTSLTDIDGVLNDMKTGGEIMSYYPDPDVQAIGKAITVVAGIVTAGLGTSTINRTISNSVTSQHSYSINSSETEKIVAKSSNGGPGQGDVICFYTNVNLLWYQANGRMKLAILGFNPILNTPSASQLKQALSSLTNKPKGTKDTAWFLDAESIRSLLALDPFTGPDGAKTQLDPSRFSVAYKLDGTEASFKNGGADETETVSHQIITSDAESEINSVIRVETDKPGFLSFLGLGETEDKAVQSTYSRSSSIQLSNSQTIIGEFILHGEGNHDSYQCKAYFDKVFGTFAFRDNSDEFDNSNRLEGVVSNSLGKKLPNTKVLLKAGHQNNWTTTDNDGKFRFTLPYNFNKDSSVISAGSSNVKLIKNINSKIK
jgi:hypothetical protein